MLQVGSVLDGKYKILQEIGHGGMSVVYLALNERANKTWAVKEVRKDGGNDASVVSQGLVAETEMLKRLNHPGLPSIIDVIDTDDSFIIVMDYIEGGNLERKLKHEGAQNAEDVIRWAKQLTDVLGYLHTRKPPIIYRDMKPSNVMLKPDGNVSLIDFGTAREYKSTSLQDTTYLGTRGYAAPEQFGGRGQTDARTDIFCLGATMYHLLTGYSPADTQFVIHKIGKFRPDLAGTGIEAIVAKCCQAEPADRYQSCAELKYALEHVHDQDVAVVKTRDRQWKTFLAGVFATIIGAVGMVTCNIMKNNAISGNYDNYITQARNSSFEQATQLYREAMDLDPGKYDAYEGMYELIANDYEITATEKQALEQCINSSKNGRNKANIQCLKDESEADYAQFEYNLGMSYYAGLPGGKQDAYNVLNSIKDNSTLTTTEQRIANTFCTLADYYVQLSSNTGENAGGDMGWVKQGIQYSDLWTKLYELVNDRNSVAANTGGQTYAIAMYREVANQITSNISRFRDSGVSIEQMQIALEEGIAYLNGIQVNANEETLYQSTLSAIEAANRALQSYNR